MDYVHTDPGNTRKFFSVMSTKRKFDESDIDEVKEKKVKTTHARKLTSVGRDCIRSICNFLSPAEIMMFGRTCKLIAKDTVLSLRQSFTRAWKQFDLYVRKTLFPDQPNIIDCVYQQASEHDWALTGSTVQWILEGCPLWSIPPHDLDVIQDGNVYIDEKTGFKRSEVYNFFRSGFKGSTIKWFSCGAESDMDNFETPRPHFHGVVGVKETKQARAKIDFIFSKPQEIFEWPRRTESPHETVHGCIQEFLGEWAQNAIHLQPGKGPNEFKRTWTMYHPEALATGCDSDPFSVASSCLRDDDGPVINFHDAMRIVKSELRDQRFAYTPSIRSMIIPHGCWPIPRLVALALVELCPGQLCPFTLIVSAPCQQNGYGLFRDDLKPDRQVDLSEDTGHAIKRAREYLLDASNGEFYLKFSRGSSFVDFDLTGLIQAIRKRGTSMYTSS
jgi:hypothetical protein